MRLHFIIKITIMKKIIAIATLAFLMSCDAATLGKVLDSTLSDGGLSNIDIGNGLKQALEFGVGDGADKLSQLNGFLDSPYKILLPAEVRKVTDKLQGVPGFKNVEAEMVKLLNRGAEDAAKSAKPIFVNAIKQMTFRDATQILMGEKNAATLYLQKSTSNPLYSAFSPTIKTSLDRVNATKYWNDITSKYNSLPFVREKINTDLTDYVTKQALKGMFGMVAEKELKIRTDIGERSTDLLRKVFAKQDN